MTLISHHEPEKPQMVDMAKLRMDQEWRKKTITDSVYLRSLFIHGYTPAEAVTELNLLKLERWK